MTQQLYGGQGPVEVGITAGKGPRDNEELNFVLAGYNDPTAKPGTVPTSKIAEDSLSAMRRRARFEAHLAGMPHEEVWEEGLSRVLLYVAGSHLTKRYCPSERGVRPYINKAIRRAVRTVVAERRGYKPLSLPEDIEARGHNPSVAAEMKDLTAKCKELLFKGQEQENYSCTGPNESTTYVQKHRQRKRLWKRIEHLFSGKSLRPKRHRT